MIKLSANGYWKFYRGEPPKGRVVNSDNPHDSGLAPFDSRYDDSSWETAHLPHTVREEKANCSGGYNYLGEYWYRKIFFVEKEWEDKSLFLEFEGAMQRIDAWLDGKPLGVGVGGFLPVGFNLPALAAGEHLLVLRLDNTEIYDVPPAKPQGALDFCYFGGLYRNAWLYVAEKLHFTLAVHANKVASGGLYIRCDKIRRDSAQVKVKAHCRNDGVGKRGKIVLSIDGKAVASSREIEFERGGEYEKDFSFNISNPELWSPSNPHLYSLKAEIIGENGEIIDERVESFGIREIEFKKGGVYINGEKYFLSGVNRHQEYPYVGFALPDSLQKRDLKLLKDMGTLCIRTAHYPPDTTFISECDKLGILCIIPTPGWQLHPNSVLFDERSYENTRRMIRWHRNHPAAMLYEPILNETDYPEYFADEQIKAVYEEIQDSSPLCACDVHARRAEKFPIVYSDRTKDERPAFCREYGDMYLEQYGPMSTMRRVRRGENVSFYPGGEEAMLRSAKERFEDYKNFYEKEDISGGCIWAGFDHNRGYEPTEAAVGLMDFFRLKKYSYSVFECQQEPQEAGVKCFIANAWTENSPRDVTVYTNAEAVRFFINDRFVCEKKTDGKHHVHPPVVFEKVEFEKGVLRAEAIINGEVAAICERKTPEIPYSIKLVPQWEDCRRWVADGADLLAVHAYIVDINGTICVSSDAEVSFKIDGNAAIVGDGCERVGSNPMRAEAGVASVLLRAGTVSGRVILTATSKNLHSAEIELNTEISDRPEIGGVKYPETKLKEYPRDEKEIFSMPESIKDSQSYQWEVGANKKATASSCKEGCGAENANGNAAGKFWIAADKTLPQWWQCDLGKVYSLNGVFVGWQKDGLYYDYEISTSENGDKWHTQIKNRASGQSRIPDRFAKGVQARFARITVNSVSAGEAAGIYKVEIFGVPKKDN